MAATVLHPSLDGLLHPEPRVRRDAIAALPIEHRYALRQILFFDDDAQARVLAVRRLAALRDPETMGWLLEALDDRLASVRDAAWSALARFGDPEVLEAAVEAMAEEEVWWVRRSALRAAVAARGEGALGLLLGAFADPFWRVRHAAAQAVALLGAESEAVREKVRAGIGAEPEGARQKVRGVEPEGAREKVRGTEPVGARDNVRGAEPPVHPERSRGARADPLRGEASRSALKWLELTWTGKDSAAIPEPSFAVDGIDDDPAVTTARLERDRGAGISTADLVQLLGDAHEALLQVARRVLLERKDPQTAWLALFWLDEVRVPQAAEEARVLLARLGGDERALAERVLRGPPRPGALRWAAGIEGVSAADHFENADPKVRAAVARAVPFARVIADASPRVRKEAVAQWNEGALGSRQRAQWAKAVLAAPLTSAVERRIVAEAAAIARDLARLALLSRDPDPRTRAIAVGALIRLHARTDGAEDPDHSAAMDGAGTLVRAAAVDAQRALALLTADPDPKIREAAAAAQAFAADPDRLGRAATVDPQAFAEDSDRIGRAAAAGEQTAPAVFAQDPDPWVRAAAVDAQTAPALLAEDPDPWVRRAALERLVSDGQLTPQVRLLSARLAAESGDGPVRVRAAGLFTKEVCALPGALELALQLSLDERLDVRAAIASVLEVWPGLDDALDSLLARPSTALGINGLSLGEARVGGEEVASDVVVSALSWRMRNADRASFDVLKAQSGLRHPHRVNDHLDALTLLFPDEWIAESPALESRRPTRRPMHTEPRGPNAIPPTLASYRDLGTTGLRLSPIVISGVHSLQPAAFELATRAGVNAFFWEREYQGLTRFLRSDPARRESLAILAGTYHSGPAAIRRDVESALRSLRTDRLDVYLLFWVRSAQRLDDDNFAELQRLGEEGKLKTFGFSTHLREVATAALASKPWPVVMTRYSAAHPGAATALLPAAVRTGTGILAFSSTCYGRLLDDTITAADCYGYCLHEKAVSAVISAPRHVRELEQNLATLTAAPLTAERMQALTAHGARVHQRSKSFNALIRQAPGRSREVFLKLLEDGAS